jgi:hypothetical protein
VQDGFKQAAVFCSSCGQLRFQLLANRHQFVHLGNKSVLFSKREATRQLEKVEKMQFASCLGAVNLAKGAVNLGDPSTGESGENRRKILKKRRF